MFKKADRKASRKRRHLRVRKKVFGTPERPRLSVYRSEKAQLSGGMAKRVGLARAIADDPAVIFFDEPTTGLDPIRARAIDALIRGIVTVTGATAIIITHDMASCRIIGDRVALLADGRIAHDGPVADMDRAPALAGFLGIPSAGAGDHAR